MPRAVGAAAARSDGNVAHQCSRARAALATRAAARSSCRLNRRTAATALRVAALLAASGARGTGAAAIGAREAAASARLSTTATCGRARTPRRPATSRRGAASLRVAALLCSTDASCASVDSSRIVAHARLRATPTCHRAVGPRRPASSNRDSDPDDRCCLTVSRGAPASGVHVWCLDRVVHVHGVDLRALVGSGQRSHGAGSAARARYAADDHDRSSAAGARRAAPARHVGAVCVAVDSDVGKAITLRAGTSQHRHRRCRARACEAA